MITVLHSVVMAALIVLPLLRTSATKKVKKTITYRNDRDTTNAQYAVNDRGYLEQIKGNKVSGHVID